MKPKDYEDLLQKYLNGTCSVREKEIVETWLENHVRSSEWKWTNEEHKNRLRSRLRTSIELGIHKKKRRPALFAMAASFIFIFFTIYFLRNSHQDHEEGLPQQSVQLIMGDTQVIDLTSSEIGVITDNDVVAIRKTSDKSLSYKNSQAASSQKASMNTLIVPVGQVYQLTLPDGTQVWLNCESSLRFPSWFADDERLVELRGEAYFEVSEEADRPFRVLAKDQEIEVLGTHFNVSAYPDQDQTRTALLEGLVLVTQGNHQIKLTSGRQVISSASEQLYEEVIDPYNVVSWKEGYFSFVNQDIRSVMNDVARWYGIKVEIKNRGNGSKKINGTFSRSRTIDELLLYLEKLEVAKFQKKGRRVTVML